MQSDLIPVYVLPNAATSRAWSRIQIGRTIKNNRKLREAAFTVIFDAMRNSENIPKAFAALGAARGAVAREVFSPDRFQLPSLFARSCQHFKVSFMKGRVEGFAEKLLHTLNRTHPLDPRWAEMELIHWFMTGDVKCLKFLLTLKELGEDRGSYATFLLGRERKWHSDLDRELNRLAGVPVER